MIAIDKHWIQTFTGLAFYPLAPDPDLFSLIDTARSTSKICRFNGHVNVDHYSVAEHCVRVSWLAEALAQDASFGTDPLYAAQWGLPHDQHEGYVGDIVRPVKVQTE